MEKNAAKKTLLMSLVLSGAVLTVARLRGGDLPQPRQYIGMGAAYFMAAVLLEIAPPLGAGLALLIAVSMLLRHGEPALAGITGAQKYSATPSRASVVPAYPRMTNVSRGAPTGGAWNGSKVVVQNLTREAKAKTGVRVNSSKRTTQRTVDGNISDHATICRACYAEDLVGTVGQMDAAAVIIARHFGVKGYRKGTTLVVTGKVVNGFRIQVLYRTQIGGNHDDHIHVGARLASYDPETEGRPR